MPAVTDTWFRLSRENAMLFQPCAAAQIPTRVPGGKAYNRDRWGPTGFYLGLENCIRWDRRGGDWIDAALERWGNVPWASATAAGAGEATLDVTALVNYCATDNRWLALLLQSAGAVNVSGLFGTVPPRIDVAYQAGGAATLACTLTALASPTHTANSIGSRVAAVMAAPVFLEFERPAGAVVSATLRVMVEAGSGALSVFVLDPPQPTLPLEHGVAAQHGEFDAGLSEDASVIFSHRYMDGGHLQDWALMADELPADMTGSANIVANYDPAIYGLGASNTQRYPHVGQGRWVGLPEPDNSKSRVEFVPSTHTQHGFEPLAPGMGALKVTMFAGRDVQTGMPLVDGSTVGYSATVGTDARLMLPEPLFGELDEMYVRHYMRIGRVDQPDLANRLQVYRSKLKDLVWTEVGGKLGIMPAHPTTLGGVSQTSGGPFGWQGRMGWNECDEPVGPETTSWRGGMHLFDFAGNNPPGFSHGASPAHEHRLSMLNGGWGSHFAVNRWYCIEGRLRLNGVMDTYPGYADTNGLIEAWVDGRKVYSKGNMVMRTGPAYSGYRVHVHNTPLSMNQWAEVALYGASDGLGYAGVAVRHSGAVAPSGGWFNAYVAFVSRISAGQVKVVLVKRTNRRLWTTASLIANSAWVDGDVLRLEATGTGPTVVKVKRNGATLITYTDTTDTAHRGTRAGVFGSNNDAVHGWRLGDWSAGDGAVTLSDSWAYSDGLLADSAAWTAVDEYGVGRINGNRLWFPASGDAFSRFNSRLQLPAARSVGIREAWWNWFHGGTEQSVIERHLFITGVAVGRSYIGPMQGLA